MKAYRIVFLFANLTPLVASIFGLIQTISENYNIFPSWLMITLYSLALVGYVSSLIIRLKIKKGENNEN